jgi:hypothetical protein
MRRFALVMLVVASGWVLPDAAFATTSCFLSSQVNATTQQWGVTADNGNISAVTGQVASNVTLNSQTCVAAIGTANSCGFEIMQTAPGPASFQIDIADGDPAVTCGPITNADGLPVELIEFRVE